MKVFGHPKSTCTRKVLTTLAEKGHEAEFVLVDLMTGAHKQPEHLARQPFGVVPALEDDGFMMYESRAIARYLDRRLSGPSLTPSDPRAYGRMEQWLSVEQSYFSPASLKIIFNLMFAPMMGRPQDMAAVDQGKQDLARVLDVAAEALSKQEYLAGSSFSLADICWMPYLEYLFPAGVGEMVTSREPIAAWWQRIKSRPSWVKVSAG